MERSFVFRQLTVPFLFCADRLARWRFYQYQLEAGDLL